MNKSVKRMGLKGGSKQVEFVPFPPMPESFLDRFPELRPWMNEIIEVQLQNQQAINAALSSVASG